MSSGGLGPAGWVMSPADFDHMLESLGRQARILAPVRLAGRGRFSDTDSVRYAPVTSGGQIEHRAKSDFSAKEIVFPVNQTLLHFVQDRQIEPDHDPRPILLFARACDIHAFDRLDDIFLRNGPCPDPYYQALRQRVRFVLMECKQPFENCFCVSMGCNRTENYAMAVGFEAGAVRVRVTDPELGQAIPPTARPDDFAPAFVTQDPMPVSRPEVDAIDRAARQRDLFGHEMWKEYAQRCIACGRCNTHCPTCSCFTTFDVDSDDGAAAGQRRRTWASCHVERFTTMAGGHVFREDIGSRMRFKVMHKIYDFPQRFGRSMCVGCGRCDDACPEYISLRACINKLSAVVGGEDGPK